MLTKSVDISFAFDLVVSMTLIIKKNLLDLKNNFILRKYLQKQYLYILQVYFVYILLNILLQQIHQSPTIMWMEVNLY